MHLQEKVGIELITCLPIACVLRKVKRANTTLQEAGFVVESSNTEIAATQTGILAPV